MSNQDSTPLRRFWRWLTTFDFKHDSHVCGGGYEVSTTISVTAFYRSVKVTYVRANKRRNRA